MTLPHERARAVLGMRSAMLRLTAKMPREGAKTARVDANAMREVVGWLRHYPTALDVEMLARAAPDLMAVDGDDWSWPA